VACQQNEGQVGPGRLLLNPGGEFAERLPEQGFLRKQHRPGADLQARGEFGKIRTNLGLHAGPPDHFNRSRAIPADRRQNEDA
jgi:hypothetical protein